MKLSLPSSWRRGGQGGDVDPGLGELGQDLLGVAAVGREEVGDLAVVGEGVQGRLRHRVDREGRGEGLDVERVGGVGVLGPGASPEQPLRPRALVHQAPHAVGVEQLVVGAEGAAADRDPEPVDQVLRHVLADGDVPAADEERGDGGDVGVEPGLDPPLEPAHVGLGGAEVLLVVEEQGDVDRDAGEDRLLDRLAPGLGAGDLDEDVVALALGVQRLGLLDRRRRVVGDQRRDLERDEAVDAGGAAVDVGEEVGGVAQVGERQLEEDPLVVVGADSLARCRLRRQLGDLLVVGVAAGDRLVEDRRVRGQAGDREVADVALEHPFARASAG